MKVAVWDTYVKKNDGAIMHFDILVPEQVKDEDAIHNFGKEYLMSKMQETQKLSSKECRLCHIEEASPEMIAAIEQKGYYIIEMQNCY